MVGQRQQFYRTTRPVIPPAALRENVVTTSQTSTPPWELELRPFQASDLPQFRKLRTQYEVMKWTSKGAIDASMDETETWMKRFLPPNDQNSYQFSIFVRKSEDDYEHIGVVGCHIIGPVANIGYMLRQEWWGSGLATAAVKAYTQCWWALQRQTVDLEYGPHIEHSELEAENTFDLPSLEQATEQVIEKEAQKSPNSRVVPEILFAEIEESNIGSRRVLEKCGFKYRGRGEIEENGTIVGLGYFTMVREQPLAEAA